MADLLHQGNCVTFVSVLYVSSSIYRFTIINMHLAIVAYYMFYSLETEAVTKKAFVFSQTILLRANGLKRWALTRAAVADAAVRQCALWSTPGLWFLLSLEFWD